MTINPPAIRDRLLIEVNKALDEHEDTLSKLIQRNTILEEQRINLRNELAKLARLVDNMDTIEDRPDTAIALRLAHATNHEMP
jgi:hypothetical protein